MNRARAGPDPIQTAGEGPARCRRWAGPSVADARWRTSDVIGIRGHGRLTGRPPLHARDPLAGPRFTIQWTLSPRSTNGRATLTSALTSLVFEKALARGTLAIEQLDVVFGAQFRVQGLDAGQGSFAVIAGPMVH